jgi:hypothetical protein
MPNFKSSARRRMLPMLAALLAALAIPAGFALFLPSVASACPIQGCGHEPDDPAPHPPPGPPAPKYRITIDSLRAFQTEDDFSDEAYIKVTGTTVWGPHTTTELQMQFPGVSVDVTGPIWVSLYDEDGWPDPDDWLGDDYPILPLNVGQTFYLALHFWRDGADYQMGVHVVRLS